MDNRYATLHCALTIHPRCDTCKKHTMEILSSIVGTYDISLDAEKSLATIVGQVDPNYCIRAIGKCDGHAEVVWAKLSHPKIRSGESHDYSSSSYHDSPQRLTWQGGNIPEYSSHARGALHDYGSSSYHDGPQRLTWQGGNIPEYSSHARDIINYDPSYRRSDNYCPITDYRDNINYERGYRGSDNYYPITDYRNNINYDRSYRGSDNCYPITDYRDNINYDRGYRGSDNYNPITVNRDNINYDRSYRASDNYYPITDNTIPYHNEEHVNPCTIV